LKRPLIAAFIGLSGLAVLLAYAKAWNWLFHQWLEEFVFANTVRRQ
jgi:hypothetical protein